MSMNELLGRGGRKSFGGVEIVQIAYQRRRAFAPSNVMVLGLKEPRQVPTFSKGLLMIMLSAQSALCCEEFRVCLRE